MSDVPLPDMDLAAFCRDHRLAPVPMSSRVLAAALTAALYGLLILAQRTAWTAPRHPPPPEIVMKLMPPMKKKEPLLRMPAFLAHLIKPPAQTASPPPFIVASITPPPRAELPPSTASPSPLESGVPAGTGAGQGGAANGATGASPTGCFDAVWGKAVTDRIGQFYFYPNSEKRRHVTGLVLVQIGARNNGRLAFLKVNKSSGVRALDEAALEMVRRAVPLPRIPERMHLGRVDVLLPIFFGDPDPSLKPSASNCAQ